MTLEDFARVTVNVLARNGVEGYAPTLVVPRIKHTAVIADFPENIDPIEGIRNVIAAQSLQDEDVFFGVALEEATILIGHHMPGGALRIGRITHEDGALKQEIDAKD